MVDHTNPALAALHYHTSGAVERGEKLPIMEQRTPLPDIGQLMAYEEGELDASATLELFAQLIASGMAWHLQGSYGRAAAILIERGYITRAGIVTDAGRDACEQ